jgi:peptidoglycan/LPS O-acetylase OafA/YrhL
MNQGAVPAEAGALSGRVTSLDGLRGIAALAVLLTHAMLTVPSVAAAYDNGANFGSWDWALTYSPLHIFWAGNEAVYLFFVLSGIVLTIPILKRRSFSWASYYPKRLVRLYLPVWGAIAFGVLVVLFFPRGGENPLSAWVDSRPASYPVGAIIQDASLVRSTSGVVGPLWSLRVEVYFSLLLPLYVGAIVLFRRWWMAKAVLLGTLLILTSIVRQDLVFLMLIFAVGVLMVDGWQRVAEVASKVSHWKMGWPAILAVAVLLTTSRWVLRGFGVDDGTARRFYFLAVIGVTIFVVAAVIYEPFKRMLSRRAVVWLGRVSFSLYLIHEPVLIAFRSATPEISPWLTGAIGIALSLVLAEAFYRCIERPSHKLAQIVGRKVDGLRSVRRTPTAPPGTLENIQP